MADVATETAGVPDRDDALVAATGSAPDAHSLPDAGSPRNGTASGSAAGTGTGAGTTPAARPAGPAPTIGRLQIPRRAVNAFVAAILGLVLLTVLINRFAGSAAETAATTTTPTTVVHQVVGGIAAPPAQSQLYAPLSDLLDLTTLQGQRAAGFSLTDAATGRTVTLASLRGHVVVLTFLNANCRDLCPVLAAELHKAAAELPRTSVPVSFVTVNTDPLETAPKGAAILHQPFLASLPGWVFLTGSLHALNRVWKDYGISITADAATGVVSHNELLYFITAKGDLAWSALPFADEANDGSYSLPESEIDRFAAGIAHYTEELAK